VRVDLDNHWSISIWSLTICRRPRRSGFRRGFLVCLTTTVTATQLDGDGPARRLAWPSAVLDVVRGYGMGGVGFEGVAEGGDGGLLEAGADVGVDGGGDADVGVAEEFLDHDEFDALLQEEGRGGVPEVVEPDAAEVRAAEESGEVAGEVGGVDRPAGGVTRLAHANLSQKIDDGGSPRAPNSPKRPRPTSSTPAARTARQALNLLSMEHKATRIRRGVPSGDGGMRVEEVTVIGPGPAQGTPGTLEAFTGPSPEEMQARTRMDALADALEDALGQIQELRERLDRIDGDRPRD
jgi:hypothetical protein